MDPGERLLQFFDPAHLSDRIRHTCELFEALARAVVTTVPANAERTVGLRKLLEAKDATVRAILYREPHHG
jgi:hypothetical protein